MNQIKLTGEQAFYNHPNYLENTKSELFSKNLLVSYRWNSEHKVTRIAKQILSILVFPIGVYHILHMVAGLMIIPAAARSFTNNPQADFKAGLQQSMSSHSGDWKYKRIIVEVDGNKIDAMIVGRPSTFNNGRWVLASNGNNEFYESKLIDFFEFKKILISIEGNALIFNYTGVGASSGFLSKRALTDTYQAMLNFLEDQEKGIGAKEIIGIGRSIGGVIQGDALNSHELKKGIKYVFVKRQSLNDLSTTVTSLISKVLGIIIKLLNWNLSSVHSSKKMQCPEIIMQTANVTQYTELKDSSTIIDDGIIRPEAALAKALLDDVECPKDKKLFIGMPEMHNDAFYDAKFLASKINDFLKVN